MKRATDSVPFVRAERPEVVIQNGARLDDRGFEEFRNVCECLVFTSLPMQLLHPYDLIAGLSGEVAASSKHASAA